MRRGWVAMLAMVSMGTVTASVRGQTTAPAASAPPAAPSAPPAASAAPGPSPASAPSTPASDEALPDSGYELGVRIGFALATGDLNGLILGAMPLQIDAGRHFGRQLILGVYGYAAEVFPIIGNAYGFGFGAEGQYFLSQPILGLHPWLGVGGGYVLGSVSALGNSKPISGPEGGVQAGLDYKKGFGPFAGFTVGSFASGETHEWITIGMRGTYDW